MATARQALRQRREQLDLSQEQVAFALGVSTTTYRSWEAGTALPRVGRRRGLAEVLEWSPATVARALDGNGHLEVNGHAVPECWATWQSLERGAARVSVWEPLVVHGLLQTAEYASAVERADAVPKTEEGIARRVHARLARQAVLARRPDPLALSVILDESVLHRVAGDRQVMADQLDHLAEMAGRANVEVRVLPLDAGRFSAAFGSFTLFTSPGTDDPYMACTEDRTGAHYLDRSHEIEAHNILFDHLAAVALPPTSSADLIRAAAKETRP